MDLAMAARRGDAAALREAGAAALEELPAYPYLIALAAIETDQVECLAICLDAGAAMSGEDPLLPAAAGQRAEACLQLLIERGAPLNEPNSVGATPVVCAVSAGWESGLAALLEAGASPFAAGLDWILQGPQSSPRLKRMIKDAQRRAKEAVPGLPQLLTACKEGDLDAIRAAGSGLAGQAAPWLDGATPIMIAAEKGHADAVALLADLGADPNARDLAPHERRRGSGLSLEVDTTMGSWTALMRAAEKNRPKAIEALAAAGAEIDAVSADGESALLIASRCKAKDAVRTLLRLGAKPDLADKDGTTPLLAASYFGPADSVEALLLAGADLNSADSEGVTPLLAACFENQAKSIPLMLEAGARLPEAAIEEGDVWLALNAQSNTQAFKAMLPLLDPNEAREEGSPLWSACEYSHAAAVPILIAAGARLAEGESWGEAVRSIFESGWGSSASLKQKALQAMLKLPRNDEDVALAAAGRADEPELLRLLLQAGLDPSASPSAAQAWSAEAVLMMVEHGADVNAANEQGQTPLRNAIQSGDADLARRLLELGADPLAEGADGLRAVELGRSSPVPEVAAVFAGFAVDEAREAELELVRLLADYVEPSGGDVRELLAKGARPTVELRPGLPAILGAAASHWWPSFEALREAGAELPDHAFCFDSLQQMSERADDRAFLEVSQAVAQSLGVPPLPIQGGMGAVCFSLKAQIDVRAAELAASGENRTAAEMRASWEIPREIGREWYGRGAPYWIGPWRSHPIHASMLLAVPSLGDREVVALIRPRAGEHDVGVCEILRKLAEWDPLGWTLIGIGFDSLDLRFSRLPEDLMEFCRDLERFCPDLIDQGFGSLEQLAESVTSSKEVHFWWD